jgi:hypothetical protein
MRACLALQSRRSLLCAALVAAAFAMSMANSQAAHAFTNDYCFGQAVKSGIWCTDGSWHTYVNNRAWYEGGGSVWLCGKLVDTGNASWLTHCGYNNTYGSITDYGVGLKALIYNGSSTAHTLYGRAQT